VCLFCGAPSGLGALRTARSERYGSGGAELVCGRPRETRISGEAKSRTFLESPPDAFFSSQKEDMSGGKRTSGHPMYADTGLLARARGLSREDG